MYNAQTVYQQPVYQQSVYQQSPVIGLPVFQEDQIPIMAAPKSYEYLWKIGKVITAVATVALATLAFTWASGLAVGLTIGAVCGVVATDTCIEGFPKAIERCKWIIVFAIDLIGRLGEKESSVQLQQVGQMKAAPNRVDQRVELGSGKREWWRWLW